ncbi:MAG: DUF664 domain-containing protein [Pyrinomonadaceae bacterium]|nr:DUF664 domain-containing protein [Pyrinomonadaceae bacterium]
MCRRFERCLAEVSDEDVWWRPNEVSNSIGNLLLHLCGNLRQWVIGGIGGREFERHRQEEFDERQHISASELLARLKSVVSESDEVIGNLTAEALQRRKQIQGHDQLSTISTFSLTGALETLRVGGLLMARQVEAVVGRMAGAKRTPPTTCSSCAS